MPADEGLSRAGVREGTAGLEFRAPSNLPAIAKMPPKGLFRFILSPAVYGRSFHSLQLSHFKIFGNMMDVKWFMIFQFAFPLS